MKFSTLAISMAATLVAGSAFAQSGYTIKLGAGVIDPRATSSELSGSLGGHDVTKLPGNHFEVQRKSTVIFSIERALDDHFSVELVAGFPPKHDIKFRTGNAAKQAAGLNCGPSPSASCLTAKGVGAHLAAYDGKTVATVEQAAPTLFVNYKFLDASAKLRPYVGVGLNYTMFKSESTTDGNGLVGTSPVKISTSDSFGLAFQAGVTYKFDDKWSANLGWATAAVRNDFRITANNGTDVRGFYRFHPSIFSATVGYSF